MIWYDIIYIYGNDLLSHGFLLGVFPIDTIGGMGWSDLLKDSNLATKSHSWHLLATKQASNVATRLQYLSLGIFL